MQSALFDLSGRRALVTGSTRGIGLELARGLLEHGASVIVHGRSASDVARVADELLPLAADDATVETSTFDITDRAEVTEAIANLEAGDRAIDILVNNAGIQRRAAFEDFPDDDWDAIIATNLTGAFAVGRAVARGMIARRFGKIVNIGSVQSSLGRRSITPYATSKGGIVMLTRGMCADLAGHGIQVNALAPGYFATELNDALVKDPEFTAWLEQRTPAGRWGETRELVGALVFLASPASDFVNGQILYVDGGMTATV